MAEDGHHALEPAGPRLLQQDADAGRRGAHEQQPRMGRLPVNARHGVEHVVVAAPGADAHLGDQGVLGPEAERATDAAAVHLGMEAPEVGAGVDDLDLRGRDPGGNEPPPDGLAHGDDGGHPARGIPEAVPAVQGEADAAVEDKHGDPHQQSREERQRARLALVAVHDLGPLGPEETGERPHTAEIQRMPHGQRHVRDARGPTLLRPERARPRRHHHLMPARVEPPRELPQLDGGSREVVSLGVELQNAHQPPKNWRTAATTSSTSASVCPAEIGSVRISVTIRSVRSSAGALRCSTAGCLWQGTG